MPNRRIEGKVAGILNKWELVLNVGAADGVQVGMRFAVLNPSGVKIKDPDTNVVLGSVDLEKAVVKVVRVQERICVTRTFRKVSLFSSYTVPTLETLPVDASAYAVKPTEQQARIRNGDVVIQVVGEEYGD